MAPLALSLAVLIGSHIVPSAPGVREHLLAVLGRRWFYALYSLVSVAALAAVVLSYRAADPDIWLWTPGVGARHAAILLMPLALILLVGRLTTRPDPAGPRGIYRVSCVPGSLAVLIWALLHLANVGAARTVLLFAAMAGIALFALVKNVARAGPLHRRAGILPFGGALRGRMTIAWGEIGWWRPGLAVLLYAVLVTLHPLVIGVDPLAGIL